MDDYKPPQQNPPGGYPQTGMPPGAQQPQMYNQQQYPMQQPASAQGVPHPMMQPQPMMYQQQPPREKFIGPITLSIAILPGICCCLWCSLIVIAFPLDERPAQMVAQGPIMHAPQQQMMPPQPQQQMMPPQHPY